MWFLELGRRADGEGGPKEGVGHVAIVDHINGGLDVGYTYCYMDKKNVAVIVT